MTTKTCKRCGKSVPNRHKTGIHTCSVTLPQTNPHAPGTYKWAEFEHDIAKLSVSCRVADDSVTVFPWIGLKLRESGLSDDERSSNAWFVTNTPERRPNS